MATTLTQSCLIEFINTFEWAKNQGGIHTLDQITGTLPFWNCMNEIYPGWFDESMHPNSFDNNEECMRGLLHFLTEYHEGRYRETFKLLQQNVTIMLYSYNPLLLTLYEMIILATLHADDSQLYIDRILTLSEDNQLNIQQVIQYYNEQETPGENYLAIPSFLPSFSQKYKTRMEGDDSFITPPMNLEDISRLQTSIENLKESLLKSENEKEILSEKLQNLEKNLVSTNSELQHVNKLAEQRQQDYVKEMSSNSQNYENQISSLKEELEAERKAKRGLEEQLSKMTKETEEEMKSSKTQTAKVQQLELQITKFKTKIEELSVIKDEKKHLELRLKALMDEKNIIESEAKSSMSMISNLDTYKNRVADLEASLGVLSAENEQLQKEKLALTQHVQALDIELQINQSSMGLLKEELAMKTEQLQDLQTTTGSSLGEQVSAYSLPSDSSASPTEVAELRIKLDELQRIKEILEKSYAAANSKISALENKIEQGGSSDSAEYKAKVYDMENKFEEQNQEIRQLRKSKDELTAKVVDLIENQSHISPERESVYKIQMKNLEEKLEVAKAQAEMKENLIKAEFEKEFESRSVLLSEQLQIKEREISSLKEQVEETIEKYQEESKLVCSTLFKLSFEYHKLKGFCEQLNEENEAVSKRFEQQGAIPYVSEDMSIIDDEPNESDLSD